MASVNWPSAARLCRDFGPRRTECAVMVEVNECDGEADEQISLDVYNAVWPHDAITMDEVRTFKASVVA